MDKFPQIYLQEYQGKKYESIILKNDFWQGIISHY